MSEGGRNRHTPAAAKRAAAIPDIVAGRSVDDIAAAHGVSNTTVRRWMAEVRDQLIEALGDAIAQAAERLHSGVADCLARLEQLRQSDDEKVALGAINSWLDRAGVVKTERREVTGKDGGAMQVQVVMSDAEAEELAGKEDT